MCLKNLHTATPCLRDMDSPSQIWATFDLDLWTLDLESFFVEPSWHPFNSFLCEILTRHAPNDMSQTMEKCPILQCWRSLQKFLFMDQNADDFQNLISFSLCTDICSKIFVKIRLVVFEVVNRQTDKQTDKHGVKHYFLGEGNKQKVHRYRLYWTGSRKHDICEMNVLSLFLNKDS